MRRKSELYRRGISLVLTFMMVFTLMPVSTFAAKSVGTTAVFTYSIPNQVIGPASGTATISGDVVLNAPGIVLRNTNVKGRLTIGMGVGDGIITLSKVKVTNTTSILGGAKIDLQSTLLQNTITVNRPGSKTHIIASGATNLAQVTVAYNATTPSAIVLEESGVTASYRGFQNVYLNSPGSMHTLIGAFGTVTASRANTIIDNRAGSSITTLVIYAKTSVMGEGTISTAKINANGVILETRPVTMTVGIGYAQPTIVDKKALRSSIAAAEALVGPAVEGTEPGQYATGSKDEYKLAIAAAILVRDNANALQPEINTAVANLAAATEKFNYARVVDKGALISAISAAEALVALAVEGTGPGQYPAEAIAEYKLAIADAKIVRDKVKVLQPEIDAAVANLASATEKFNSAKVPENSIMSGKLIFTFNDAKKEHLTNAEPILTAAGFPATVYVSELLVATTESAIAMTVPELNSLYEKGWDISNFTQDHNNNGLFTEDPEFGQLVSSYQLNEKWLEGQNWPKGAHHVAYPGGYFTDKLIQNLKQMGVKTARTTNWFYGSIPNSISGDEYFKLPVWTPWNEFDLMLTKNAIDYAVAFNRTVIIMLDKVDEGSIPTGYLQELVDYAKKYSDTGRLGVMTVSEWYKSAPFAPGVYKDDNANVVYGMASGMEYKLDNGGYKDYVASEFSAINFAGAHTLEVRIKATNDRPESPSVVLTFTTNPVYKPAKLVFTFDDGWDSQYDMAFKILEDAGFDGTIYANRDLARMTTGPFMTEYQLDEMYDAGWEIGNHTTNHREYDPKLTPDDPPPTLAELKALYEDNQKWMLEQGWVRGMFQECYPSGYYTGELIDILKGIGAKTGRTTEEGQITTVSGDGFFTLPIMPLETVTLNGNETSMAQDLIEAIDRSVVNGDDIIVLLHQVRKDTDPEIDPLTGFSMSVTVSDLQRVVDYAKMHVQAGDLSVMTMGEWYEAVK